MRFVRSEVATVTEAMKEFRKEVNTSLSRLTDAVTDLVRLEERQASLSETCQHALKQLAEHEKRLDRMDVAIGRSDERGVVNTTSRANMERAAIGIGAGVGGAIITAVVLQVL